MKRLPLIALVLLSGCIGKLTGDGSDTVKAPPSGSYISCYDTGYGVKCVQTRTLSAMRDVDSNGSSDTLMCATDNDKQDPTSQSSNSGPSASDDAVSDSSDTMNPTPDMDGDSDSDASGESDSMSGDGTGCGDSESTSTSSSSTTVGASDSGDGSDSDGDSDAVSDSQDCDCVDPDGGGGTGTGGTPPMSPGEPPLT